VARERTTRRTAAAPKPTLKAWSYSTWNQYNECAKKTFFAKIDRSHGIKDELGAAGQRGSRIHEEIEAFTKRTKPATKNLALILDELTALRESPTLVAEGEWAFTRDWRPTAWRNWDGAWVRMKLDAHDVRGTTLLLIDYKTGKERDYDKQLELYGLGGFKTFPQVDVVEAEIWYTDQGKIDGLKFQKAEAPALEKTWEKRVKKMMADTEFRPRPGNHCRWCPFSKAKGGPCVY
jgi:RecB family exonuclease